MNIPCYVISGFLDAGKTTFLNHILHKKAQQKIKILVLQFEAGEKDLIAAATLDQIYFPKKQLEENALAIIEKIDSTLIKKHYDEIWIEWNGITPFSQLESLFLPQHDLKEISLDKKISIKKVIHLIDGNQFNFLMQQEQSPLPEQIINSDLVIIRPVDVMAQQQQVSPSFLKTEATNPLKQKKVKRDLKTLVDPSKIFKKQRQQIRLLAPRKPVLDLNQTKKINRFLEQPKPNPLLSFGLFLIVFFWSFLLLRAIFLSRNIPIDATIQIFLGTLLQAIPFLLLGVIISSVIQIYLSERFIERYFPRNLILGFLFALLGGFALPVCDCASIPIARSLIKKKIPPACTIMFLVAAPIINPIVILSTYYAFNGQWSIIFSRMILGMLAAFLIGCSFLIKPQKEILLPTQNRTLCDCGYYNIQTDFLNAKEKFSLFLQHAQAEFFDIGRFLLLASFLSAIFQTIGKNLNFLKYLTTPTLSILILMALSFLLSLCSSSDAIIGKSFSLTFPFPAVMSFLIFGPVMDIKNIFLLNSGFKKSFILRLFLTTFIICFALVLIYGKLILPLLNIVV